MGLFIDTKNRCFYLLPFPTIVIKIEYKSNLLEEYSYDSFGFKNQKAEEGHLYFVEDKSGLFKTRFIPYFLNNRVWKPLRKRSNCPVCHKELFITGHCDTHGHFTKDKWEVVDPQKW